MSWFAKFIGTATGAGVTEAANGIGDAAIKIRSALTGEMPPETRAGLEKALIELESKVVTVTAEINKVEAQSGSLFIAGWRPAIGWVCATSLAIYYWPRFSIGMYMWVKMSLAADELLPLPDMGIGEVIGLVASLLGLGVMRTIEKGKKTNNKH